MDRNMKINNYTVVVDDLLSVFYNLKRGKMDENACLRESVFLICHPGSTSVLSLV